MSRFTWFRPALAGAGLWAMVALTAPAQAQQAGTVSGVVAEAGTQRPLPNAQVSLGTGERSRVVATDADGRYTFTGVPAGQIRVRVRLVGFTSQSRTVAVVAQQTVQANFELRASVISLDEIVVTGAGTAQSKKQLGNTIVTVNAEDVVKKAPVRNISEVLAGREPGVTLTANPGIAGGSGSIEIRGTSSLSQGSSPVVYVDGVRIDNGRTLYGTNTYNGSESSRGRAFDNINPEAIERIEILKGAAAATLYGSEANAGVIQIFTKKGTAGRPRFNFRIDQGMSAANTGRVKPQSGFARTTAQAADMNAVWGTNAAPYEPIQTTALSDMYGTGYHYTFAGDVAGGSEDFQYFIAGRWTFDDGPVGGSNFLGGGGPVLDFAGDALNDTVRRLQGSAQFTLFPRDRLSFRISTQFTDTDQRSPDTGNNIYAPLTLGAFAKPENSFCADGASAGRGNGTCDGPGNWFGTAFASIREATNHGISGRHEHFNVSTTVTYQAATSLNFDLTFGVDATNQNNQDFWPFAYNIDNITNNDIEGYRSAGRRNNREITADFRSTWDERFGSISSQLVVGGQGFISRETRVFGDGAVFPGPGLEVVGAASDRDVFEGFSERVNIGLLFQERVGFNDWIFVTGGGRWDRNSAFGDSTSGQFYPKVSVSVIPSDLPSWSSELVSSLRLRGAFGKSGQQPGAFDRFLTFESLSSASGPGVSPDNLGNPNLKPEVAREIEFGGEVGLFNDRAAFDVTYWTRQTRDALVARQFPVSGGFTNAQLDNIGLLSSRGLEVSFNTLLYDTENLSVDFFANGAYIHEEVRDMGDAPPIKAGGTYTRYRNFLIGPDSLGVDCNVVTSGVTCRDGVAYYAPGVHLGYRLIPTCDQGAVYYAGANAGQARTCYTPGSTVPYDTNGDGIPDDIATFRTWLGANDSLMTADGLSGFPFNSPSTLLTDDEDGDGDLQDNYLGKPTPDWAGAFGANFTLWNNLQVNTLFEFRVGNYGVNNLTDAFRQANPLIGRNTPLAAQTEATIEDPGASTDAKFDAAMTWAEQLAALRPFSGLNTIKNANFLRFRELGITYTAPRAWTQKLKLDNLAFNVNVRNLALWTAYDGVDPEAMGRTGDLAGTGFLKGIETFGAMVPRRFTFSVRFGF